MSMPLRQVFLVFAGCMFAMQPAVSQQPQPAKPALITGMENARLAGVMTLDGTLYHVQGVDLDQKHIWITSVDTKNRRAYLHQFNRATGKFERRVDLTDGNHIHPGGFSLYGNSIWVPVAEYKPNSSADLVELDKNTLAIKRKITVPDHIGCLAVTGDSLIGGNWDSRRIYVFDMQGRVKHIFENHTSYQDMKFVDGHLVASGGPVDWYTWPSMTLIRSLRAGKDDDGVPYTNEGMAIKGTDLYLLPDRYDPNLPKRLFHFIVATP